MKQFAMIVIIGWLSLVHFSCGDKSTGPGSPAGVSFSWQSSKCIGGGSAKVSGIDSLFAYSFKDSLVIDFSVTSNCCPDSNRFSVSTIAGTDTLAVVVADTAEHLCRCICTYMIHCSFGNLPEDRYVVRCSICSSGGCDDPIYLVNVFRKK